MRCKTLLINKYITENKVNIYRLWYEIYFNEMSRNKGFTDTLQKIVIDDLEPESIILTLEVDGNVIGSSRINTYHNEPLSYYDTFYELDELKPDTCCIVTKYMVQKKYRNSNFSYLLALATVDFCKKNKIKWIVMDCSPVLYDFFEKLGFKNHKGIKISPEYGEVKIMKFDTTSDENVPLRNLSVLDKYINSIHY